ncbi:MAG: hypothetical protein IKL53_08250 [Lachnospiraceae bacterium]|nr:hypothetical protein [Lachnospiraceae bacterium]
MDNILCIIGIVFLVIACIVAVSYESRLDRESIHITPKSHLDTYKTVLILCGISLLSFILFAVSLMIGGYMSFK